MKQIASFLTPGKKETLSISLDKDGSEGEVLVAFIGREKESFILKTLSEHKGKHTESYTMVRGVLFDQSQADIEGLIKIFKDAQHTNAFLEEKILLIGSKAKANAEPQLEIEANEVKASHAATVGKLNEEQLFYLMSRGINRKQAQQILVEGFLQPVIDRIEDPQQKAEIQASIKEKISK